MAEPTTNELVEQLRTAKTIPEMASILTRLMHECGIYNFQQVGYELARIGVTAGLGRE
jgi:hypothetical protein